MCVYLLRICILLLVYCWFPSVQLQYTDWIYHHTHKYHIASMYLNTRAHTHIYSALTTCQTRYYIYLYRMYCVCVCITHRVCVRVWMCATLDPARCALYNALWYLEPGYNIYVFSTCTRYWGKSFDDIIIDLFAVQLNFTAYSFSTSAIIIRTHTQALEQSAYFDFKVTESTIAWWIGSCVLQVFW